MPVTVDQAAAVLGISPTAVRKRIERGQLRGHKARGRWLVDIGDAPDTTAATATHDTTDRDRDRCRAAVLTAELAHARELLTETRRDRDRWHATAVEEQTATRELRVLLLTAQRQIAAPITAESAPLEDAARRAEMPVTASSAVGMPDSSGGRGRWRRFLGTLTRRRAGAASSARSRGGALARPPTRVSERCQSRGSSSRQVQDGVSAASIAAACTSKRASDSIDSIDLM